MKKKILVLVSILFVFALAAFGCGGISLKGGPSVDDTVYGNGGTSVVKGDYLYFANAYCDYNNLGHNDNKYDEKGELQKKYGIYRTKLNENGVVSVNSDGVPTGAELLVPQVGGHAVSGLYICGNYLYYVTPFTQETNSGEPNKGRLRFERVKLNGSDHEIITGDDGEFNSECSYSIVYIEGVTYITILQDETLTVYKSKSNGDVTNYQIASSVDEMVAAEQQKIVYNQTESEVNKYVYYTKVNNNIYSLYKKSLNGGEETPLITSSEDVIELVTVKNNRVYFKVNSVLKSSTFIGEENIHTYTNQQIVKDATSGIVDFAILDDTYGYAQNNGIAVVAFDGSKYNVYKVVSPTQSSLVYTSTTQVDILFATGNEIYFQFKSDDDTKLYSLNILNGTEQVVINSLNSNIGSDDKVVMNFDYDEDRLFYFATAENSNGNLQYLHMALLNENIFEDSEGNSVGQYVGVLHSSDVVED